MSWLGKVFGKLFGGGKGIVEQVSDTVDKWKPSPVTQHKMAVEDSKQAVAEQNAGDESQNSARNMPLPTHGTWFDSLVDGLNRLVRPAITYWIVGGLVGFWRLPSLGSVDPIMMNIVWTVITFWFGSRMLFKDLPAAYVLARKVMGK